MTSARNACTCLLLLLIVLHSCDAIVPGDPGSLFYVYEDKQFMPDFPTKMFFSGSNGAYVRQSYNISFDGLLTDWVLDLCANAYFIGSFSNSRFDIQRNQRNNKVDFTQLNHQLPLLIVQPQHPSLITTVNYFPSVSGFRGVFESIATKCQTQQLTYRYSSFRYCEISCDLLIGGKFSFFNGTHTVKDFVWYQSDTGNWVSLVQSPSAATHVTFVEVGSFGMFVGTAAGVLLYSEDVQNLESMRPVLQFSNPEAQIWRILQFRNSIGEISRVIIAGDIVSPVCSYLCVWDVSSRSLSAVQPSDMLKGPVSEMFIDFSGDSDTSIYVLESNKAVKRLELNDNKWNTLTTQEDINTFVVCYENSVSCDRNKVLFYTVSTKGRIDMFTSHGTRSNSTLVPLSPDWNLQYYVVQDDLLNNLLFNEPNRFVVEMNFLNNEDDIYTEHINHSGTLVPGNDMQIYSEIFFPPNTTYKCAFLETETDAHVIDNETLSCAIPVNYLTNPKNAIFLRVWQRIPSLHNFNSSLPYLKYRRKLLYYDGNDLCQAQNYDYRYFMSKWIAVVLVAFVIIFFCSLVIFSSITVILLLPCQLPCITKFIYSRTKRLEVGSFDVTSKGKIIQRKKTVLGGWISILLLFIFVNAATFMIVDVLDPFQIETRQNEDYFLKTPNGFNMKYLFNRTNCDFSICEEQLITGERTLAINDSSPSNPMSRSFSVAVDADQYAQDAFYGVTLDQCCAELQITAIPQLLTEFGEFVPMFDNFPKDQQRVAHLPMTNLRYFFKSYENSSNITSLIRLNHRWNQVKETSGGSLTSMLWDAFVVQQRPLCLLKGCDDVKFVRARGSRMYTIISDRCVELASGGNMTVVQFSLHSIPFQTYYTAPPFLLSITIKLITLIGSLLGLRPALTSSVLSHVRRVEARFSHLKSAVVVLFIVLTDIGSFVLVLYTDPTLETNEFQYLRNWLFYWISITLLIMFNIVNMVLLNAILAWNGNFFSQLRIVECKLPYLVDACKEPLRRMAIGWRRSRAFRVIVILYVLSFIPLVQFVTVVLILILWQIFVKHWWNEELGMYLDQQQQQQGIELIPAIEDSGGDNDTATTPASETSYYLMQKEE